MKFITLLIAIAFTTTVFAGDGNHFDPNNRAYERAEKGKEFHKHWNKHYVHARTKSQWHDNKRQAGLQPVTSAIDYSTRNLYIFNYETDELITVSQSDIQGWHWNLPLQHTAISADGQHFWVSTDATESEAPRVFLLGIKDLDWENNTAKLKVESVVETGPIGEPSTLPFVEAVPGSTQQIADWIQPPMTQVHGQTFLPFSPYMYMTAYTGDQVYIFKNEKHKMTLEDTVSFPGFSEQTHGITFNSGGSVGLGTGYFYDNHIIDVYEPNLLTGELTTKGQIKLELEHEGQKFVAPMTHLIAWIDTRYAYVATMQFDRTSLSPSDWDGFVGPSVWLLDAVDMTATLVIQKADNTGEGGVFRSASDVAVVNGKLYVAEEDSINKVDVNDAEDGFVSVFDITDRFNPVFIKRLEPGVDFPTGYNIAHTFSPTVDGRYIMLGSWHSGYVIKIDTYDDTVAKIWGPEDGLVMPHGLFPAGGLR
jgi:hypothetical protein